MTSEQRNKAMCSRRRRHIGTLHCSSSPHKRSSLLRGPQKRDGLPRSLRSLAMTGPKGLQAAKAACHSEEAGTADVGIRIPKRN